MTANTLTFSDQFQRNCTYCGGELATGEQSCMSCGARHTHQTPLAQAIATPTIRHALVGLFVWFFLGMFGGYAYWAGQKVKAYARVALWLSTIGWISVGAFAKSNGDESGPLFIVFPFFATILLLMILWMFDLAHLMKRLKARM